jgi:N-acetylneuraminate synthase/sialic acid synthase
VAVKLRKSVVFARDLPAGHVLTEADLTVKCPGHGVSPIHWDEILGRTLASPVRHEDLVRWELLTPAAGAAHACGEELPLAQSR